MRVSIDAGHGGHDPCGRSSPFGARGPAGTLEKDVVLRLARRVAAHLGPEASLTRDADVNLSLGDRIAQAHRHGSSVLVSLHANAGPPGRRGSESWVHSRADAASRALARAIQRQLGDRRGEVQAGELALLTPERLGGGLAACIVEVDYLSDRAGERRLLDPAELDRVGRAIARGVRRYLAGRVGRPARPGPALAEATMFGATVSALPAVPTGAPWRDLISFRPSTALQRAVKSREWSVAGREVANMWHIHRLDGAYGPINLDRYEVLVRTMPTIGGRTLNEDELLEHLRLHINDVLDASVAQFSPYDEGVDGPVWRSSSPLGAVVHIDMPVLAVASVSLMTDDGSVICTEHAPDHWIFSTLKTGADGIHPVSGNRMFGVSPRDDGWVVYTRGADRATGEEHWAAGDTVFTGGDKCWRAFQRGVAALINRNGGSASVGSVFSERFDWDEIAAAYHAPSVGWI